MAGLGKIPSSSLIASFPSFGTTTTPTSYLMPPLSSPGFPQIPTFPPAASPTTLQSWALPPKLYKKILDLDFVDMSELLPDGWHLQEQDTKCCHQRRLTRRGPVTDILVWIECFSVMVAVLSSKYPDKTPQLMAYQRTIVRASKSYTEDRWVTYDTCYRRNAAITKSLDWGQVDFNLYNETFTGRAIWIERCKLCSSEHHKSEDCVYAADTAHHSQRQRSPIRSIDDRKEPCKLYNTRYGNRCRYHPCKYRHQCSNCGGAHPRYYCSREGSQLPKLKSPSLGESRRR